MHRTLLKFQEELITPDRAVKLLEDCKFENQRPLSQIRVNGIVDAIQRKQMMTTTISLCSTDATPEDFKLIDGQHRLWAVVLSGVAQMFRCQFDKVRDMQEMGILYASFDIGAVRTMGQRIQAIKGEDVETGWVALIGGAVLFAENGFDINSLSRTPAYRNAMVRNAAYDRWAWEADILRESMIGASSGVRKIFNRQASLAIFLVTARYIPDKTRQLACEIGDNSMLEKYSPAWQFLNSLGERSPKAINTWNTYARSVAQVWNAHYVGEKLVKLGGRKGEMPVLLKGTPFTGKIEKPELYEPKHRGDRNPIVAEGRAA